MRTLLLFIILLSTSLNAQTFSPHITGVLINACPGVCGEGHNEVIFLNSGSFPINVSTSAIASANIIIKYGSTNPPTDTYSDGFTSNTTYVNTLNTNSTCGVVFYDALTIGTIPANSVFMIMRSTACYSYSFSSMCSVGNIYVLFSTDASWGTTGNFLNTGTTEIRYFSSDFSNIVSPSTFIYSYQPSLLTSSSDGDGIAFNYGGGAANTYFNNGCTPSSIILPIELLSFNAYHDYDTGDNKLEWSTSSEINNDKFDIESSIDGNIWDYVGHVDGSGNSNTKVKYSYIDDPLSNLTYYRLKQIDFNGDYKYSNIIYVDINDGDDNIVNISYIDQLGRVLYDEPTSGYYIKVISYEYKTDYIRMFKP